jgi:hypothetical protein
MINKILNFLGIQIEYQPSDQEIAEQNRAVDEALKDFPTIAKKRDL